MYADPDIEDAELVLRSRKTEVKSQVEEEDETEIVDEEQAAAKRAKEELQHDREIVDLCVWKPPITGFGDMSLEEAAEALGLYSVLVIICCVLNSTRFSVRSLIS